MKSYFWNLNKSAEGHLVQGMNIYSGTLAIPVVLIDASWVLLSSPVWTKNQRAHSRDQSMVSFGLWISVYTIPNSTVQFRLQTQLFNINFAVSQ